MPRAVDAIAWLVCGAGVLGLATAPVSPAAQLALGLSVSGGMIALWRWRASPLCRHVFLALGTVVVLRYVYWRATSTLPPLDQPVDFGLGVLLFLAEMYCVAMLAISLFIVADPIRRPAPPRLADADLPTVDVFVPSYNEDKVLLATTIAAARSLDYPPEKLTVYLLDDGGTDQKCGAADPAAAGDAKRRRAELQALCHELGAVYLTRPRNEHAKAGNLNAGLQRSTGELVVVFDADHAPVREFLRETVGYFRADPRLFLVQTPHFFLNPDPIEKNLSTFARMPSENEMFYSVVQRGLDKWNAAFFCGSAAVLRRTALDEAGGFSGVTITEDCETALDLHSRGWNSLYVDKPLIAGLQPETFVSFIGQRSRWARGMMQILLLKNPILKRGLSIPQRICYVSNASFWLFPFPRLAFMLAPLLYIFFNVKMYVANVEEFGAYTLTYMAVNVMMQNFLYGRVRWPWVSELYEYVQSVYLGRALLTVVANPRKPTFNVTAKGLTLDADHLSELAWPYFAIFGLLVAGLGVAAFRIGTEPVVNDLLLVVSGWTLFNLVIAGVALGAVSEKRERRRSQRLALERRGELSLSGERHPVAIEEASTGGVRVRPLGGPIPVRGGAQLATLSIEPRAPDLPCTAVPVVVRRTLGDGSGRSYGVQYFGLRAVHYHVVADLMFGDGQALARFRDGRRAGRGILGGTLLFLSWSLRQTGRGLDSALRRRSSPSTEPQAGPAPTALAAPHA